MPTHPPTCLCTCLHQEPPASGGSSASGASCNRRLLCIKKEPPASGGHCVMNHIIVFKPISLRYCWYCKQYSYWGKGVCETPNCRLNNHGGGGKNKGIKRRLRGEVHRATALRGEELKVATQQAAAQQAAEPPASGGAIVERPAPLMLFHKLTMFSMLICGFRCDP